MKLFKDVAIFLEQEKKEFFGVVGDEIDFHTFMNSGVFDGVWTGVQPNDFGSWENMDAAKIVVGVRRGEAIKMSAADRDEKQRVGIRENGFKDGGIQDGAHVLFSIMLRRALSRNSLARS